VITGCGGSIDISQNAKKVVFCGSFAVKSVQEIDENGIRINHPGKFRKFVNEVQQVSFSGRYALEKGQQVVYVTERAVFTLKPDGLTLIEIAPGIDLEKDVIDMMEFKPVIDPRLREIDLRIYAEGLMNLGNDL